MLDREPAPPRVSICIPTYRGERTLAAAISSVFAQTFADFELIVVDDGSPDDTTDVVRQFSDARLRYLRNPHNLGPQGNWNRCLELARGRYFKLLPHDDLLHPQCLARQVAVLDADTEQRIALVFSARDVIGPDGRVLLRARGMPGAPAGPVSARQVLAGCLRHGTNVIGEPGAVLFRKSLADTVGRFDATHPYVIDLDYWVRLLAHGDGHYSPDALASFRVWRGSWSVAIGAGQSTDFRNFMRAARAQGRVGGSRWDRLCGLVTPTLNNVARLAFYRLFVR